MFRKLKNFITRHEHSFDLEEIETSYHFVRTGILNSYTDPSFFFGGTAFLYDGYWERIEMTTATCFCGEHGNFTQAVKKVRELSNGARIIEMLNDLALHGENNYHSPIERRVKNEMGMEKARRKLNEILRKNYKFINA